MTPAQTVLPRWRGFNLLEMFTADRDGDFREEDYVRTREWGFDFARIPLCYRWWADPTDLSRVKEEGLRRIDRAVDLGRQHGVHVCLNFHHAPGYCINVRAGEALNLWKDDEAQRAFCRHWAAFAERYRGRPGRELSFNLVNEPRNVGNPTDRMTREDHERVIRAAVAAVRAADPERLVLIDGLTAGREPCPELLDLGVAQSCRAYEPMGLSHWKASWVQGDRWPVPVWPGAPGWSGEAWDRARLEESYRPWVELARQGVGVHCGEGGAFRHTPHDVFLRWLRDVLEILTRGGIGYALWNLRGAFGVLDSQRDDVAYEPFHGHQLDRKLLELLREF